MTKKPKTSRNQNLMQRIYSCNDYVCMHKKEPEGFRKRRKLPTVLAENWCKNRFLSRFRSRQLLYHFLFICCDDVSSFFRKYNKSFEIKHDKFQIMITVGSSYIRKHSWWVRYHIPNYSPFEFGSMLTTLNVF